MYKSCASLGPMRVAEEGQCPETLGFGLGCRLCRLFHPAGIPFVLAVCSLQMLLLEVLSCLQMEKISLGLQKKRFLWGVVPDQ